jgi:hypothetical protein
MHCNIRPGGLAAALHLKGHQALVATLFTIRWREPENRRFYPK